MVQQFLTHFNLVLTGASPFGGGLPLPQFVTLESTVTTLKSGTADVGYKLVLSGNSVIQLGTGAPGSTATLQLNSAAATSRSTMGRFQPVPPSNNGNTPSAADSYDWNCNLNWRMVDASGSDSSNIPLAPPCYQDSALFKNDGNTYGVDTYGGISGATTIAMQATASSAVSSCPSSGSTITVGPRVTVNIRSCASTFQWGATTTAALAKACPNTCSTYTLVTASSATYYLFTAGAYAGNAYKVATDPSGNPTSLTLDPGAVSMSGAAGDPATTYTVAGVKVSGSGAIIVDTTVATTINPAQPAGSGDDTSSSSGGSMLIIAIIIVAVVVIIAIGAFVYIKKRGQGSDGAAPREGAVSFENPMYDGEKSVGGADAGNADGLYSDPVIGGAYSDLPAGGGGASGYMDVPAGQDGAGYLDVNDDGGFDDDDDDEEEGGVSGYMDVAPGGDDNDDV